MKVTLTTLRVWSPKPEPAATDLPACGSNSWHKSSNLDSAKNRTTLWTGSWLWTWLNTGQRRRPIPSLSLSTQSHGVCNKLLPRRSRHMTGASSLWFQVEMGVSNWEPRPHPIPMQGMVALAVIEKLEGKNWAKSFFFLWPAYFLISLVALVGVIKQGEGHAHPLPTELRSMKKVHNHLAISPPS